MAVSMAIAPLVLLLVASCDADQHKNGWGPWSACSKTCGGGTKTRSRMKNGKNEVDTDRCNTDCCQNPFPKVTWTMTSSFPSSLDTIYGGATSLADYVSNATNGNFVINVVTGGGLQAVNMVRQGTVDACHTGGYYYYQEDPTWALASAVPFSLPARGLNAWHYRGGGIKMYIDFLAQYNLLAFPGGNTGTQMGGWYNREIKTVADLQGLKVRLAGLAREVFSKFGAVPQTVAGDQIYSKLKSGAIDAAEWVGPYDDEKLKLNEAATYYYYPGWWEGSATMHFVFNKTRYNKLPPLYQKILRLAMKAADADMLQHYDYVNPSALQSLRNKGVQLKPFPPDVMQAFETASNEVFANISATNPTFSAMWTSIRNFMELHYNWLSVSEYYYDTVMLQAAGPK